MGNATNELPTSTQIKVLKCVHWFWQRHREVPSYRQLATRLELRSHKSTLGHVAKLTRIGLLDGERRVTSEGMTWL